MATPIYSNGIFLRDAIYPVGSHVDSYHLMQMMRTAKPTDLGIIEYWAQTQQLQAPLYTFASFGGKNTITVDDPMGRYTWQTPVVNDMPHVTRDVDPTNTRKGISGQTFQIALSRKAFGHTDIITYDKYAGLELYIVDYNVLDTGNNEVIYTVRLVNNDNTKYLDNKYLVPQTVFFSVTSARGEYGERWAEVNTRAGYREYYNFVGQAEADASYSVSSRAHAMMKANGTKTNGIPVKEIWQIRDTNPSRDPSMVNIQDAAARIKQAGLMKSLEQGWVTMSFVTSMEQAAIQKVVQDVENYLMWGKGGRITQDGPDDIRLTTGLWQQMNNSFIRVYNIGTFTKDILESEVYNYFNGRVDFKGPDPQRKLIIQTGIAGMKQMNAVIQNMAVNSGLVINASEVGAVFTDDTKKSYSGMDLNFGYAYTGYTIPFLANMKFVVNPALDPVEANQIENPFVNGYRLSSYCYIIWDVTDNGGSDNIFLMKHSYDEGMEWFYQNGTCDYMGNNKGFASVGDFNGYRVKMKMMHKAVQVKDPTRILKVVPLNPITKKGFGMMN